MPPVDTALAGTLRRVQTPAPESAAVHGWGGGAGARVALLRPRGADGLRAALDGIRSGGQARAAAAGVIARGMGRSYGDAAQRTGGLVVETTNLKGLELDQEHGTVTAGAGVTIGELLHALVPAGWVVPVVPGTQHVTIGGAIASDIHGKNHGTAGTFGSHVLALGLLIASGEVLDLEPGSADGLFEATLGGMGLTGVILWARVKLRPVASALLSVDTDRVQRLDDALEALATPGGSHRVAWLDLLGSPAGRGVVTRAEHLSDASVSGRGSGRATVSARATVPRHWPGGLLQPSTVRAFNELRYRAAPRRERGAIEDYGTHMFPLDGLNAWPRLYGQRGFVQYQLVVPSGQERVLETVIGGLRHARVPCYLAVLKDFGPANSAPLSFPIAGWTLAIDVPRAAPGVHPLLDAFDEQVAGAGGRVYLSKDLRLRPEMVPAMYPRIDEWRAARDSADPERVWGSDLAVRTGLLGAEPR